MSERSRTLVLGALSLVLVIAATAGAGGQVVAIVADLKGGATLTTGGASREAQLFDRLAVGDSLQTAAGSTAVVAFVTGKRFRLGDGCLATVGDGDLSAKAGKLEALAPVGTVPAIAAIPSAEAPGRRSGALRLRGASGLWGAEVEDLYPRDGVAVLAANTVLSFRSLSSAEAYKVDVEDELGENVFSLETRSAEVAVPAGVLLPGKEYYWRVRSAGPRAMSGRGEALFVTLSEADASAREAIRAQAEKEGSVDGLLLLAEIDRSLGLHREACGALVQAAARATDNPHIAKARDQFGCQQWAPAGAPGK